MGDGKLKKYIILTGTNIKNYFKNIDLEKKEMKIIFPAKEEFLTQKDKNELKILFENEYYEVPYDDKKIYEILKKESPDVLITAGWRRILNKKLLKIAKLNINIHPAILPDYKGYHPEPYVIQNNEVQHGVTAHKLTENLDAGDIVLQRKFGINEFSTVASLKDKAKKIMPSFFSNLINNIEKNSLNYIEQNHENTKIIAPKRTPEDSQIDSSKTLNELYDKIRSCDSEKYPAFFYKNGYKVYVKFWRDCLDKEKNNKYDI